MPAVKVTDAFGNHPTPRAQGAMQKFYRTFSVGAATPTEHKRNKVTAIAASLEKKISDPIVKLNSDNVQRFLSKIHAQDSVNGKTDGNKNSRVYENVNIGSVDKNECAETLLDETKGYSSIYENITVIGKPTSSVKSNASVADFKLSKALESFDKILTEFSCNSSLTQDFTVCNTPKLQKSKTCSIIESRCILKKANSDPDGNTTDRNKVIRNNSIDKTTSLWNLDDMKGKEITSPLVPLQASDKMSTDRFATYKISSRPPRNNCIKTEDLKKLDVKTRILKKTISNPPSTPVPVISKNKTFTKKNDKKVLDLKKSKPKTDNISLNTKTNTENRSSPRPQIKKAKSVWELGNDSMMSPNLERTRSTTSIAGSPSKIPVIRSHMSQSKFSSTRALFSPTPVDLNDLDQTRECGQKKKLVPRKPADKPDFISKQIKQKSQINLKAEPKRQLDKVKTPDKKINTTPKISLKDYTDEMNAIRTTFQQKKIIKREPVIAPEPKRNGNGPELIDSIQSPVKSIVKKLELKTALETKAEPTQFTSCRLIPPVHKEICVANTTFHNHLSTLVGRNISYVQSIDDSKICTSSVNKTEEKISDAHSDCSDDSGHVSNDAANDNDHVLDESHELIQARSADEPDCKAFPEPKEFSLEVSEAAVSVPPVRPARRHGRSIEVASGTRDVPKVDKQIMFRGGVVGALDARRDAALGRVLVRLQARARGLLARRRAARLRTLHTAARCVQRNVRAFLAVRDWPWWRLLVRVAPLLAVHRTEHRLKQAQDELETLRAKLEKVESERTHYKNEAERLESKLSEVGGELTEERAAAALATERADAEAAERLRVEKDNRDLLANNQRLQQASERLELELLHWRSSENGTAERSDSEGSDADSGVAGDKYKQRWQRAQRELQLLRAQLRRQHEDDLDQLVTVKKQLEKKAQDAFEEVEEQRAVAAQWKRKLQKLTNDMADLKSLLDEQTCRNNILEKRQRKFDAELQAAQEELKRERAARERLARERDLAHADKYAAEQSLAEARLEIDMKEERLAAAARELEEKGGGGDELSALRKARADLERKVRDQEEELDELAGQIQLLESSKLRVEMLLEQQRKEARLEAAARDDELEETRANAAKKLKMLESQLETEHSERSLLLRERHELERRLAALEETARAEAADQAQATVRLKRDLKRYRALLRDAQAMLEQKEKEGGGKTQIRQLKNQVEDLELSLRAATKARAHAEAEAAEATAALEEAARAQAEASERARDLQRDAAAARAQLDDAEEEAGELLKKFRSATTALTAAQGEARAATARAEQAAEEARALRDQLADTSARLAAATAARAHDASDAERRLALRVKELEARLELEGAARARTEAQLARLRDAHDALAAELGAARAREQHAADDLRKLTRQMRELKEENAGLSGKLAEGARLRAALEARGAEAAAELAAAREEARLAARRAAALQAALQGDLSSPGDTRADDSSDADSYSSDESIGTFLANHSLSAARPAKSASPDGRQSRSSGSKQSSPSKEPPPA